MKNALYRLTFLFLVLSAIVHANDKDHSNLSSKFVPCEKIYVQPDQIAITNEGIFIKHNNEWIPTGSIQYDASGLFISNTSDEWSIRWFCPKCGHSNAAWRNTCENCGHRPIK